MTFWCLWQQFALLIKSLRNILDCFTIALGFFVFISPRMNLDLIYYIYTNLDLYIFILPLYTVPSKKMSQTVYKPSFFVYFFAGLVARALTLDWAMASIRRYNVLWNTCYILPTLELLLQTMEDIKLSFHPCSHETVVYLRNWP